MPRVEAIPFEAEYKYMATLHGGEEGPKVIYVKGAVETLVEKCDHLLTESGGIEPLDKARVLSQAEKWPRAGCACSRLPGARCRGPSRARARARRRRTDLSRAARACSTRRARRRSRAVAKCRGAGIRVKMITGDHVAHRAAIAAQIGLGEQRRSRRAQRP